MGEINYLFGNLKHLAVYLNFIQFIYIVSQCYNKNKIIKIKRNCVKLTKTEPICV